MLRCCLLFCLLLVVFSAGAQQGIPQNAQQAYNQALRYKTKGRDDKAAQRIAEAIRKYPAFAEAYRTAGGWLCAQHRFAEAAVLYRQGAKACPHGDTLFALPLAAALLDKGDVNEALRLAPAKAANPQWAALRRRALFLAQGGKGPRADSLSRIAPWRICTSGSELYARLSADGRVLYFTRRSPGGDDDLYAAEADSCGGWLAGRPLPAPVSTQQPENGQMIAADGHYLFFARGDMRSQNGWDGGGSDLFMAYTAGRGWSVPQSFGATINSPAYEGEPCLSPDNRRLYFSSDRPGGYGGRDIWCAVFENSLWRQPFNLGPSINTPGDETGPFLYTDGETLLFSSTGHPGYGGADVFAAKRFGSDSLWSEPQNLGAPVNSTANELGASFSPDGRWLLFASDRDSTAGRFDVFSARLPAALRPHKVALVAGCTRDSLSGERLTYGNIFFRDSATGKEVAHVQTNRGDGSYCLALPAGHTYYRSITRTAYQESYDTLRLAADAYWPPDTADAALLPYDYVKPVHDTLAMVLYYEKNNIALSDSAAQVLKAKLGAYRSLPGARLLISGYTDDSGTPQLNEQLSYQRAAQVAALLQAAGYTPDLLTVSGLGEAQPVAVNDTEEHRRINRRVEIVVRY